MTFALPRVAIAGLKGGSGKTTVTLGLLRTLRDQGKRVRPFKKGPDYIDPFWHSLAAGEPCRNLDPYLMGRQQVQKAFAYYGAGAEAAVVEGNRGLFDGLDAAGSASTAELAKWLKTPVLLLLDCSMASRTLAAVCLGCRVFDKKLNLAGAILNPVANSRQERVIRQAVEAYCDVPVVGAIPRLKQGLLQRHMGLLTPQEHDQAEETLAQMAAAVRAGLDLPAIWQIMSLAPDLAPARPPLGLFPARKSRLPAVRIGVLRDAAFAFYYQDNLDALSHHGAELVFCSALSDDRLPEIDALYIGGGFPETHAAELSANESFRHCLRQKAEAGLPVYAECGGLIYLGRSLALKERRYPMAGVLPLDFVMTDRPVGHGYSQCRVQGDNPFLLPGQVFRAHEFHYARLQQEPYVKEKMVFAVERGQGLRGGQGGAEGILKKNTLATFHHIHVLGHVGWAEGMVQAARQWRLNKLDIALS